MRILAISGSLRSVSSNSAVLQAAKYLVPADVEIVIYAGLADLPHFNPDQNDDPPAPVKALRELIGLCDGLIISSPEYAHGIAGALKNALDWLVGCLEFPGKLVMLINTSPRSVHAPAQLREVLFTMSAELVEAASIDLPLLGRGLDARGIAGDSDVSEQLATTLKEFVSVMRSRQDSPGLKLAP